METDEVGIDLGIKDFAILSSGTNLGGSSSTYAKR